MQTFHHEMNQGAKEDQMSYFGIDESFRRRDLRHKRWVRKQKQMRQHERRRRWMMKVAVN